MQSWSRHFAETMMGQDCTAFGNIAWLAGLIVINEIRQISRKKLDFPKLTETKSEIS